MLKGEVLFLRVTTDLNLFRGFMSIILEREGLNGVLNDASEASAKTTNMASSYKSYNIDIINPLVSIYIFKVPGMYFQDTHIRKNMDNTLNGNTIPLV